MRPHVHALQHHHLHHHHHHHHHNLGIELLVSHQGFRVAGCGTALARNQRRWIIKSVRAFISLAHTMHNEDDKHDNDDEYEQTTNDHSCDNHTHTINSVTTLQRLLLTSIIH